MEIAHRRDRTRKLSLWKRCTYRLHQRIPHSAQSRLFSAFGIEIFTGDVEWYPEHKSGKESVLFILASRKRCFTISGQETLSPNISFQGVDNASFSKNILWKLGRTFTGRFWDRFKPAKTTHETRCSKKRSSIECVKECLHRSSINHSRSISCHYRSLANSVLFAFYFV